MRMVAFHVSDTCAECEHYIDSEEDSGFCVLFDEAVKKNIPCQKCRNAETRSVREKELLKNIISNALDLWAVHHGDEHFITSGYRFNDEFPEYLSGILCDKQNTEKK